MILVLLVLTSLMCQSWGEPAYYTYDPHDPPHHHSHHPSYHSHPNHHGPDFKQCCPCPQAGSATGGESKESEEVESRLFPSRPSGSSRGGSKMEVLFSWKIPDFTWPSEQARENAIRTQRYIPNNTFILDVDIYEENSRRLVFVTLPRARPGVPVTLATVSHEERDGQYLLAPFPDWRTQNTDTCEQTITSVFRTHIDPCGRLWVLDSGNNDVFDGASKIVCPPKILIFDLKNKRFVGKYEIPKDMYGDKSLFVTIAVDTRNQDCSDAYAYIADSIVYKMIVFNLRTKEFWRLNSIFFYPYPDQSSFNVAGVSFSLMGGIFGLAIGPQYRGNRRLYFHCIDSVKQSWVDTKDLRNQSLWRSNMDASPRSFNLFSGTRSSQSAAATMTPEGIMFFGLLGSNEVACWNSQNKFEGGNIHVLAKDDVNLQFNSGIKVYGTKLYALTSRLQNYVTRQIRTNEDNYRVMVGDVMTLTRGTSCEVPTDPQYNRFEEQYEPDSETFDADTNAVFRFDDHIF